METKVGWEMPAQTQFGCDHYQAIQLYGEGGIKT